ncbi:MAG: hypothetical protein ACHQ01_07520 [Candidatus Limnocylindrales bacterium]
MADMRKCIGSAKFGIEAHEAPVGDFPAQPSQKGGLGRMCKPHWNQYTKALRKAALALKAADTGVSTEVAKPESEPAAVTAPKVASGKTAKKARVAKPEPILTQAPRGHQEVAPEAGSQGDAG